MKKSGLILLIILIFLSGCGRKDSPESENLKVIQPTHVTPSLEPVNTIASGKINQLSMTSIDTGFALTDENHIIKTMDGGVTWSDIYTIKEADIRTGLCPIIYSMDKNTLYIVARYDGKTNFLSTTDGGTTWSSTVINSKIHWVNNDIGGYDMNFIDTNYGYIMIESTPGAGQMLKALYKTTDAGKHWIMLTADEGGDDNLQGIIPVGIGGYPSGMSFTTPETGWTFCFCYGPYGIWIYKTDNGGKTWSMLDKPQLPEEFLQYKEEDLCLTAYAPSFYGGNNRKGKLLIVFHSYSAEVNESEYVYSLLDNGDWRLEGKCDTIISNVKFFDDNIGIGLDKNGCLCTTKDGGFIWNKVKGFSDIPTSNELKQLTPIADQPTITQASPMRIDETTIINGPKYAYKNWVKSTIPKNGSQNISPSANMSITFGQDMNPDSLNENTIQIIEGKHLHNISELYHYDYDAKTRVLNITFKDQDNNIGSGNGLDITITKDIMNSKNVKMGVDLHFGYMGQ